MPVLGPNASEKQRRERIKQEMHKFKHGKLRSSSGKKVTSRKQAIAIALHEAGKNRARKRRKKK